MVRTDSDDPDLANISGFEADIDHVLFAVGDRRSRFEKVDAYLVPIDKAEEAFRSSHRDWRAARPDSNPSKTWVIWFDKSGSVEGNRYSEKWKHHSVGASLTVGGEEPPKPDTPMTIAEAKRLLAKSLGVRPEDIKISVSA